MARRRWLFPASVLPCPREWANRLFSPRWPAPPTPTVSKTQPSFAGTCRVLSSVQGDEMSKTMWPEGSHSAEGSSPVPDPGCVPGVTRVHEEDSVGYRMQGLRRRRWHRGSLDWQGPHLPW